MKNVLCQNKSKKIKFSPKRSMFFQPSGYQNVEHLDNSLLC